MPKLEPWQAELLINMEKSAKLVFNTARQSGKSDWVKLYQQFMNQPTKRFQLASSPLHDNSYLLMIADYMWWTDNEREILNWMAEQLPRGIEHQQGMVLTFDSDQQRMMFLLRWS
jgi:hypothetical protein